MGHRILVRKGLVSIIIPTYNRPEPLKNTLKTIFIQSYKDFEVIIVDDGSDFNLQPIIKNYPVRIIRQDHSGANAARNKGFQHSNGEFLLFCDDDIELDPSFLEKTIQALRTNPEKAYAYCGHKIDNGTFGMEQFNPEKLKKRNYISGISLIRRSKFPGFDPKIKRLQDWDLWLTMLKNGDQGVWVPEILFKTTRRYRPSITANDSNSKGWTYIHAYEVIKDKQKLPDLAKPILTLIGIYDTREDLRLVYPEATLGDYRKVFIWAGDVVTKKFPDWTYRDLFPYKEFFEKKRIESLRQLEKEKTKTSERDAKISALETERVSLAGQLENARTGIKEVEDSLAWRLVMRYRKFNDKWFPLGTRRRDLIEKFALALRIVLARGR